MNAVPLSRLTTRIHAARATQQPPIILIQPPSLFLLDERVFVSLGILRVAAVLEQAGRQIEFLDLAGVSNYGDAVAAHCSRSSARVAGITITTPQLPAACKIVERIRSVAPHIRIIAGGPHVTLVCAAVKLEKKANRIGRAHVALAKLESMFDVLVAGDGEMAVFDALSDSTPKIVDGDDNYSDLFMNNSIYDESPFPARHLVDMDAYRYTIDGQKATSIINQLGCSFKCNFCGGRNSKALRVIRTRTAESILREMEELHRTYGYTAWMNYDDELNINKGIVPLMQEITRLQKRLGVEFRLRGFVKAELFTEEQAQAMYEAGFRWLLCGFEAAHPRILENIQKNATLEDNTRVMEIARKYGIKIKALMSVGHAGETAESIEEVKRWLLDVKPADFDCTVISCYPGTPYYDSALPHPDLPDVWTFTCKNGDRLHSWDIDYTEVADYYKGDPSDGYKSYVFTDNLPSDEIVRLRNDVEETVRNKLNIPFNAGAPGVRFESSMGQGILPATILRTTTKG